MYPTIKLLSHSSINSLQSCPRRYELTKLVRREKTNTIHTMYGTVVGIGFAEYFLSKDINLAKLKMLIAWELPDLYDADVKSGKSLLTAYHAIDRLANNIDISEKYNGWIVPSFADKPAVELSFSIDLGDGYFYRGFIDLVLYNPESKKYTVLECKTTGSYTIYEAAYGNSDQAVAYGIILDAIANDVPEYNVDYLVYGTRNKAWEVLSFKKAKSSRAKFFADLMVRTEIINLYGTLPYFPTNGSSCITFSSRCEFYSICTLPTDKLVGALPEFDWVKEQAQWDFNFTLGELLNIELENV